jgi:hypothetical protein
VIRLATKKQRFCYKEHESKKRPHANHRVHPPIRKIGKSVPQIELSDHVQTTGSDEHRHGARDPREPAFYGFENKSALIGQARPTLRADPTPILKRQTSKIE